LLYLIKPAPHSHMCSPRLQAHPLEEGEIQSNQRIWFSRGARRAGN